MDAEPRTPPRETAAHERRDDDAGLAAALSRAAERGRRAHPSMPVPHDAFVASVRRRSEALRDRWAVDDGGRGGASGAWVDAAAVEDLYLAVACERRVPGAWEALVAMLTPRLHAAAARRGGARAEADALIGEVLGALALPASETDARALLDTYAGTGSLAGFAILLLVRRRARVARSPWTRRTVPLDALNPSDVGDESAHGRDPADPRDESPVEAAATHETAERAGQAVEDAWATLTPRERLVVAWKFVDGRSQKEIATALGIGEPRVSRLAAAASERLRAAITDSSGSSPTLSDDVLRDIIGRRLRMLAAPEIAQRPFRPEPLS
jgi:RNA polymerase sigma factor (sigma-70 family)